MNIRDVLNTIDRPENIAPFHSLLSNAKCEVTFSGRRIIVFAGYEGTFGLDEMVVKINDFMKSFDGRYKYFSTLSLKERREALQVIDTLMRFYQITDQKINNSPLMTQCLSRLSFSKLRKEDIYELQWRADPFGRYEYDNSPLNFLNLFARIFLGKYKREDIFYKEYAFGKAPLEIVGNDVTKNFIIPRLSVPDLYALSQVSKTMKNRIQPFIDKAWPHFLKSISVGSEKWLRFPNVNAISSETPIPIELFSKAKSFVKKKWKVRLLFIPCKVNGLLLEGEEGERVFDELRLNKIKAINYGKKGKITPTRNESFWIIYVSKENISWGNYIYWFLSAVVDGQIQKNNVYVVDTRLF